MLSHPLSGVYAAAITPLNPDFSPDLAAIPRFLDFLSQRGCHGALLLGTTGEGPSFSPAERRQILQAALSIHSEHPDLRLLAGTGTPSLRETIDLTQEAFGLGINGVVVLPPYYYRKISEDGLFAWFSEVITHSVPADGVLFYYHIPAMTGIPLSFDLLARLKDAFPNRFLGLKDSTGDAEFAQALGARFGESLVILTGNDRLFSLALDAGASGCITALANLSSPDARLVWDAHTKGQADTEAQARLNVTRSLMESYPPAPPYLKAVLASQHGMPRWPVRPPLLQLSPYAERLVRLKINDA